MCGRFVAATPPDQLAEQLGVTDVRAEDLGIRFNVAPTMDVYVVAVGRDGGRRLGTMRWGLVPHWAKDAKGGAKMINARAETAAEKPAFRDAIERRRCLVPADGFYEWRRAPGPDGRAKVPHYFSAVGGGVLSLAGLWEVWRPKDEPDAEPLRTCTILTTTASDLMRPIHDRMPVVVTPDQRDLWLAPSAAVSTVLELLGPAPDGLLGCREVGPAVGNVKNEGPELLDPVPAGSGPA